MEDPFEWDPRKAAENRRKHGVGFGEAAMVLYDPSALTVFDDRAGEERYATMGADGFGRVLVVVYTWRGETVRIISARRATRAEAARYHEGSR